MSILDECRVLAAEPGDEKRLEELRLEPYFQRLLGSMVRELDGKKEQLSAVDLTELTGTSKAVKLQGEIAGMARYLDLLTEGTESE